MDNEENKKTPEEPKKSFGEKVGDVTEAIEDGLDAVNDFILGPGDNFQEDIPAVHKLDSGRRIVNKAQTRKNINKKLFGKKGLKIMLIIIAIGILGFVIYEILNAILLA